MGSRNDLHLWLLQPNNRSFKPTSIFLTPGQVVFVPTPNQSQAQRRDNREIENAT